MIGCLIRWLVPVVRNELAPKQSRGAGNKAQKIWFELGLRFGDWARDDTVTDKTTDWARKAGRFAFSQCLHLAVETTTASLRVTCSLVRIVAFSPQQAKSVKGRTLCRGFVTNTTNALTHLFSVKQS